jgi:arginine-tRNA-protein transferase
VPQAHASVPRDEPSAKNDHSEIPIDEDDEDSDYDESDMMVDEEMVQSESSADTTEDCSNIDGIENVTMDLSGSRVKYKVNTQILAPVKKMLLVLVGR